jgi:hypothetical protein
MINKVTNENTTQTMRWVNMYPNAPKNVHKKYSHNSATICPISFAQICGLALYIGERKEPIPL